MFITTSLKFYYKTRQFWYYQKLKNFITKNWKILIWQVLQIAAVLLSNAADTTANYWLISSPNKGVYALTESLIKDTLKAKLASEFFLMNVLMDVL